MRAWGIGENRNAGLGKPVSGTLNHVTRDFAECVGMTDRDLAAKARRLGASCDFLDFRDALQAAVMQMNVDADAMSLGDAEDDVKMSRDVTVMACGIKPADQIGAGPNGFLEQVGRSGRCQDTALGKRDDLD